jgi:hypothetical protein
VIIEGDIGATLTAAPHPDNVSLGTVIVFEPGSFYIDSMVGKVKPEIDIKPVAVEMAGVPDFLSDDDARMDFENPEISLHVENPFGLPILLDLDMQGWKNGEKTHTESVKVNNIQIPANPDINQPPTPITVILSRLGGTNTEDIFYYAEDRLRDLFLVIPDSLKLKIEAQADPSKEHTIRLGKETGKFLEMEYEVNLTLSFGKDMSIVYKDTTNGWNEDVKNLDIKRIDLETEILNTIPLELSLSGYAIDVDGKKLDRLIVDIKDGAVIPPCREDSLENSANIVIEIVELIPAFSDNPTAVMKKLDGIVLNFTAKSTETINNRPLKSTQYMLLKGMKARIPGGVRLNMND